MGHVSSPEYSIPTLVVGEADCTYSNIQYMILYKTELQWICNFCFSRGSPTNCIKPYTHRRYEEWDFYQHWQEMTDQTIHMKYTTTNQKSNHI